MTFTKNPIAFKQSGFLFKINSPINKNYKSYLNKAYQN
jgi:hypothetical protein